MGLRGPRKKDGIAPIVAVIDSTRQRLKPPSNLSGEGKKIFEQIVNACDPRQFREAEKPLLVAYCRALLIEQHFGNQITGDQTDIGFNSWERAVKVCGQLASKLRLCPSARYDARQAQRQAGPVFGQKPVWDFDGEVNE